MFLAADRQRVLMLRLQQLLKQSDTSNELRGEIKNLQADNLKLYEKVRYLESYSTNVAGASNNGANSLRSLVGNSKRDEELGKYRNLYEDSMNPFEAFKGRVSGRPQLKASADAMRRQEQSRALSNLNPIEKILFTMSSFILGNRVMRNVFVAYACLLHLIVFSTLYDR